MKILYIDDSEPEKVLVRELFAHEEGVEITCVSSIKNGIEELKKNGQELIVCDIILPGEDGLLLGKALEEAELAIPFILVSGIEVFEGFNHQQVMEGYLGFMLKPFTPERLRAFMMEELA